MALISKLVHQPLEKLSSHKEVECTYDVIEDDDGKRYLQFDSYGSKERQIPGKKSQSIRLDQNVLEELKKILKDHSL